MLNVEQRLARLEARVDVLIALAATNGSSRLEHELADIQADINTIGQSNMKPSSNMRLASTISSSGSSTAPTTSGRAGM